MFTWIDWNLTWKFNQSSVLMQNSDNFKPLLFCKKTQLHLTPVCSGLVLQADQQAPKGCHQLQGKRSCSDFHAGTLSALLQMKPCRLEVEPRFNRANKWNHSTSCSPQHITFRDSNQSWRKWKTRCSKLVHIYIVNSMLPQTPVFFMNANAPPPPHPPTPRNQTKTKQKTWIRKNNASSRTVLVYSVYLY